MAIIIMTIQQINKKAKQNVSIIQRRIFEFSIHKTHLISKLDNYTISECARTYHVGCAAARLRSMFDCCTKFPKHSSNTVNFGKIDNEIVGPLFLQHFHSVPYSRHAYTPFIHFLLLLLTWILDIVIPNMFAAGKLQSVCVCVLCMYTSKPLPIPIHRRWEPIYRHFIISTHSTRWIKWVESLTTKYV